jgi:LCP family protein required for cell wall assembly
MSETTVNHRHSGKQRIFVIFNIALAVVMIFAGGGLVYANWQLGNRQVVTIDTVPSGDPNLNLPAGDLSAKNFLITGSDNDSCVKKDSPYYGGFGNRAGFGERSDSIMVIRVNPIDNQAAILSFPRDLWVKRPGSSRSSRINSNFDKKNPNQLIRVIKENFNINVDHYVNIDFCAFAAIVDAVGGVRVPFQFKARDKRTGFKVLRARVCYSFSGDHALAYMRSRHYQWYDPALGKWRTDPASDYGRISRQQDFTRRMIRKALDKAKTSPRAATGILNAGLKNIITDSRLTPLTVLQLGQAMKSFDSNTMGSYTMPGTGQLIDDAAVIVPDFESALSKKILSVFQGKASLNTTIVKERPIINTQIVTTTLAIAATTLAPSVSKKNVEIVPTATTVPATATTAKPAAPVKTTTTTSTTTTTVPAVAIDQATRGIVPPNDPNCQF